MDTSGAEKKVEKEIQELVDEFDRAESSAPQEAPTTLDELKERIVEDQIEYLLAQFVDIHGSAKVKLVPARCAEDMVLDGAGFAGAAVWGMGQGPHSHDLMGRADPRSYTPLPWDSGMARLACDIYVDGKPHPYCSRVNLKRVLEEFREEGYVFNVGMEPEFFLVRRLEDGRITIYDDHGIDTLAKPCYDYKCISQSLPVLMELNECLDRLGWANYQTDHEDANGQYEINYGYTDALTIADRHTFFKMMSSEISRKHGCIATHMAKPFSNQTGSGAHVHFHVADAETGENLFPADGEDSHGLGQSKLAYHFIGGVLHHARALCAITTPTVNCFKRIQAGSDVGTNTRSGNTWTPVFITYGDNNRTQMLRCPGPGRFEDRTVSGAANPYLTFAAYVGAGLDGIRNKIDPGEPNIGKNMYETSPDERKALGIDILPQSQKEALNELKKDEVIQKALGPIFEEFVKLKEAERLEYHGMVSQWEIDRYLTMF